MEWTTDHILPTFSFYSTGLLLWVEDFFTPGLQENHWVFWRSDGHLVSEGNMVTIRWICTVNLPGFVALAELVLGRVFSLWRGGGASSPMLSWHYPTLITCCWHKAKMRQEETWPKVYCQCGKRRQRSTIAYCKYRTLLFGSKLGFSQILDSLYGVFWRCSRIRL